MLALAGVDPPLAHAVAGAGGFLIPRADGTVIAAATVEEAGFDTRVTPGGLGWLSTLVGTLAPVYAGARVVETWAGLRPATADDRPLMGRAPGYATGSGWRRGICAMGCSGHRSPARCWPHRS
jgi:glycine oxidase